MKNYLSFLIIFLFAFNIANSQKVERLSATHNAVIWYNASDDCTDPAMYEVTETVIYYNSCLNKFRFWDKLQSSNWERCQGHFKKLNLRRNCIGPQRYYNYSKKS